VQEAEGLNGDGLSGDGAREAHAEGLASSGLGRTEEAASAGWLSSAGLACVRGFLVGLSLASFTVIAMEGGGEAVGVGTGDGGRCLSALVMSKSGRLSVLH
jgi:hypothetical protein